MLRLNYLVIISVSSLSIVCSGESRSGKATRVSDFNNKISQDSILYNATVRTKTVCANRCFLDVICKSFFFVPKKKTCQLHSTVLDISTCNKTSEDGAKYYLFVRDGVPEITITTERVTQAVTPQQGEELRADHWYTLDATTNCALKIYFGLSHNFENAKQYCLTGGYHLAYFKDSHAYQYFNSFSTTHTEVFNIGWYYIGAEKNTTISAYQWLDGSLMTYVDWAPSQPSGEITLGLWKNSGVYRTDDTWPSENNRFICQKCF